MLPDSDVRPIGPHNLVARHQIALPLDQDAQHIELVETLRALLPDTGNKDACQGVEVTTNLADACDHGGAKARHSLLRSVH